MKRKQFKIGFGQPSAAPAFGTTGFGTNTASTSAPQFGFATQTTSSAGFGAVVNQPPPFGSGFTGFGATPGSLFSKLTIRCLLKFYSVISSIVWSWSFWRIEYNIVSTNV